MKPITRLNEQKGMALVVALIMLLVLTLIGISAISMTTFETNIAGNERIYNLAFYTADGGIENFRGRVSNGEFTYSAIDTGSYQVTIGENACNVTYAKWKRSEAGLDYADFKVLSEGKAPFPSSGGILVESIIEVSMMQPEGYN
jgi:Tfp pilus assembly protein PilX